MAVCPKCGAKISKFDWSANCKKCGVNIMYYDMEERLEADAERAEKEYEQLYIMLAGFKTSFYGSKLAITRVVMTFLTFFSFFLPLASINGKQSGLFQIIMSIIKDGLGEITVPFILLAAALLINILNLIFILFDYKKGGRILLTASWLIGVGLIIACIAIHGQPLFGAYVLAAMYVISAAVQIGICSNGIPPIEPKKLYDDAE